MSIPSILTIIALYSITQTGFPANIQNIEDLKKLAEDGDSNAQCLLGLQEMVGENLYDPRIIGTVTVEQILLNKVMKWNDRLRFLPSYDESSDIRGGEKAKSALQWILKSADQNNKVALYCLSRFYAEGIGVKKDDDKHFSYLKRSAEQEYLPSYILLGGCYERLNEQKKAMDWWQRGYKEGDLDCKVAVGTAYIQGYGAKKDEKRGFNLIREAYDNHNVRSISELGKCYYYGIGVAKDDLKAFKLFKEGSDISRQARVMLGLCYLNGRGVEKNEQKGISIISEVASTGNQTAKYFLAQAYERGVGLPRDNNKALQLYEELANWGDKNAMLQLGKAYYYGSLGKTDKELGKAWLLKAMDFGSQEAEKTIRTIEKDQKR